MQALTKGWEVKLICYHPNPVYRTLQQQFASKMQIQIVAREQIAQLAASHSAAAGLAAPADKQRQAAKIGGCALRSRTPSPPAPQQQQQPSRFFSAGLQNRGDAFAFPHVAAAAAPLPLSTFAFPPPAVPVPYRQHTHPSKHHAAAAAAPKLRPQAAESSPMPSVLHEMRSIAQGNGMNLDVKWSKSGCVAHFNLG